MSKFFYRVDFRNLKELANKLGGVLVLDNGEPAFVVLSYDKFKALDSDTNFGVDIFGAGIGAGEGNGNGPLRQSDSEAREANGLGDGQNEIERLNQEILALKEEIRQRESAELASTGDGEISTEPLF